MEIVLSPFPQSVPGWIKPVDARTMKLEDVDVGEADSLILETIIERYPIEQLSEVITFYGSKVKKGGTIKLIGPDLMKFSIEFSHYRLKEEDFKAFAGFTCSLSVNRILDSIPKGFKLISWEHQHLNYLVTIERL